MGALDARPHPRRREDDGGEKTVGTVTCSIVHCKTKPSGESPRRGENGGQPSLSGKVPPVTMLCMGAVTSYVVGLVIGGLVGVAGWLVYEEVRRGVGFRREAKRLQKRL